MVKQEMRLIKAADKVTEVVLEETETMAETMMVLYSVIQSLQATKLEAGLVRKYGLKETKD